MASFRFGVCAIYVRRDQAHEMLAGILGSFIRKVDCVHI